MKANRIVIGLALMPIAVMAVLWGSNSFQTRELKPLGEVQPFELVSAQGQKVTLQDFKQKVWIASFIFSNCGEQCPLINKQMHHLQKALGSKEAIRLVSFSIDPKRDTPQVLSQYATLNDADPKKWLFLTGNPSAVKGVVENSFKLTSGAASGSSGGDIIHSSRLALVDSRGIIRGYYDAMDKGEMRTLVSDAKSLLRGIY